MELGKIQWTSERLREIVVYNNKRAGADQAAFENLGTTILYHIPAIKAMLNDKGPELKNWPRKTSSRAHHLLAAGSIASSTTKGPCTKTAKHKHTIKERGKANGNPKQWPSQKK
jgi:hypothetical protein